MADNEAQPLNTLYDLIAEEALWKLIFNQLLLSAQSVDEILNYLLISRTAHEICLPIYDSMRAVVAVRKRDETMLVSLGRHLTAENLIDSGASLKGIRVATLIFYDESSWTRLSQALSASGKKLPLHTPTKHLFKSIISWTSCRADSSLHEGSLTIAKAPHRRIKFTEYRSMEGADDKVPEKVNDSAPLSVLPACHLKTMRLQIDLVEFSGDRSHISKTLALPCYKNCYQITFRNACLLPSNEDQFNGTQNDIATVICPSSVKLLAFRTVSARNKLPFTIMLGTNLRKLELETIDNIDLIQTFASLYEKPSRLTRVFITDVTSKPSKEKSDSNCTLYLPCSTRHLYLTNVTFIHLERVQFGPSRSLRHCSLSKVSGADFVKLDEHFSSQDLMNEFIADRYSTCYLIGSKRQEEQFSREATVKEDHLSSDKLSWSRK